MKTLKIRVNQSVYTLSKDYGIYTKLMNNYFLNYTLTAEMLNKHHLETVDLKRSDESDAMCSKSDGSKIQPTGSDAKHRFQFDPNDVGECKIPRYTLGIKE